MKLTLAACYALKAVVHIASLQQNKDKGKGKKEEGTETVASHKIAEERKVPDRFLLKVLKPLVGARILQSTKGPNGGYKLARPANEISMLEVIEAAEQTEIRGLAPLYQGAPPKFEKEPVTPLHLRLEQICNQIAEQTRKQLSRIKISDLAAKD
jgi:Rrf2 family protein